MKTRAIVSVLGEDRVGIVAAVATTLADAGTNIEDIRQSIVGGIFSMTMLVTVDEDATPFEDVQAALDAGGRTPRHADHPAARGRLPLHAPGLGALP